jgi:cytochrome oxidase assembly protein ShyY1
MSARRWRRPTAFAWLLTAFGMAAFIGLGVWQLDRAAQKRRLFAAFAAAADTPALDLAQARPDDASRYPHVRVRGHYLRERGYWLDEQANRGRLGVHEIGVFAPDGATDLLLVDRGWVEWNHAPGTTPAAPELPTGEVSLTGLYAPFPGGGLRIGGNALPAQKVWPKLTLYLDAGPIAADLRRPLLPRMLLLDAAPASGFVREWKPDVMPPERHQGYAVQWFAFAVVALAIFVGRHWIKVENTAK